MYAQHKPCSSADYVLAQPLAQCQHMVILFAHVGACSAMLCITAQLYMQTIICNVASASNADCVSSGGLDMSIMLESFICSPSSAPI